MSIKTKDCVDSILVELPDTKASQWKRRSKIKIDEECGGGWFRVFENSKDGTLVNVIEKDGSLEVDICEDPTANQKTETPVATPTGNQIVASKITEEELAQRIINAYQTVPTRWGARDPITKICATAIDTIYHSDNSSEWYGSFQNLTPRINQDFDSKVDFDTENEEWTPNSGYSGATGFRTLANGLVALFINGGGDWESPLEYIIYFDGTELRGYVPTAGNPWNTKNNKAYGNADNEQDDVNNCQQRFGVDHWDVVMNQTDIDAELNQNFIVV